MEKKTKILLSSSKENIKIVSGVVTIAIGFVMAFVLWPKINAEIDRITELQEAISRGQSSIQFGESQIAFEGTVSANNKHIYENITVGCIFEKPVEKNGISSYSLKLTEKKGNSITILTGASTYAVFLTDLCPKGDYVQLEDKTDKSVVYRGFTVGQKITILGNLDLENKIIRNARHFGADSLQYAEHLKKTRKVIIFILSLLLCSGVFLIFSFLKVRNSHKV